MDLVWIEDLVELAAARNFSVAAEARGITQPAFSRRIRALENWVGAQLIDRSGYPVKLTPAGENVLELGRSMVLDVYRVRDECRQLTLPGTEAVSFSALHSLALHICEDCISEIEKKTGPVRARIEALDYYDTLDALSAGRCDLAFSYAHAWGPAILRTDHFRTVILGKDPLMLAASPEAIEALQAQLDGGNVKLNMPLVAYTPNCFLGKMQEVFIKRMADAGISLQTVFECSMSEVIKRMILAGRGVGWLPKSVIKTELANNQLDILPVDRFTANLDIALVRRQSHANATAERVWREAVSLAGA